MPDIELTLRSWKGSFTIHNGQKKKVSTLIDGLDMVRKIKTENENDYTTFAHGTKGRLLMGVMKSGKGDCWQQMIHLLSDMLNFWY